MLKFKDNRSYNQYNYNYIINLANFRMRFLQIQYFYLKNKDIHQVKQSF